MKRLIICFFLWLGIYVCLFAFNGWGFLLHCYYFFLSCFLAVPLILLLWGDMELKLILKNLPFLLRKCTVLAGCLVAPILVGLVILEYLGTWATRYIAPPIAIIVFGLGIVLYYEPRYSESSNTAEAAEQFGKSDIANAKFDIIFCIKKLLAVMLCAAFFSPLGMLAHDYLTGWLRSLVVGLCLWGFLLTLAMYYGPRYYRKWSAPENPPDMF